MKKRTKIVGLIFSALLSTMVFTGCGSENGAILNNLTNPAQTSITLHPDSEATLTQHGYSITINQIQFDRDATRVFVTITNNGKYTLYLDEPICIQSGKQYGTVLDLGSDYHRPEISLVRGAYTDGVFTFPSLQYDDCQIIFKTLSDDSRDFIYETFKPYTFNFTTKSQTIASQTVSSQSSFSPSSVSSTSSKSVSLAPSNTNKKVFTQTMANQYQFTLRQYIGNDVEYVLYDIDNDNIPELIINKDLSSSDVYTIIGDRIVNCGEIYSYPKGFYEYAGNGIIVHDGGMGNMRVETIDRYSLKNGSLQSDNLMSTDDGATYDDTFDALSKYRSLTDKFYPADDFTPLYKMVTD